MADEFDIGDRPIVRVEFRDEVGALTSPTTVVFSYQRPNGAEVVNQAPTSNPTAGVFTYALPTIDQAGTWWYRAKGTGALVAAVEGSFEVRRSRFASP